MIRRLNPLDFRIPKWDLNDLLERNCPICNSADADPKYIRPDSLTVRLCARCHTLYISPAPSQRQIASFYADYDANHRRAPDQTPEQLIRSYERAHPSTDMRIRELSSHMSIGGAKVLDVGFGRAQLLYEFMKLGAIPYGVELDKKAIEYAKALGIKNVQEGTLDDLDDRVKYDLVIMNDLIEHPLQPFPLLRRAIDLLAARGLVLIVTPNGDVARNEENPTVFRVDLEHMQYLVPNSCVYIARQLDMQIVHLETLGFPSLDEIDKPSFKIPAKPTVMNQLKNVLKSIPGFAIVNGVRRKVFFPNSIFIDERSGRYHLVCILQKAG